MYKVVIADDEPLVRTGIRNSVAWGNLWMEVAGEAENGAEALDLIHNLQPHILLLDIEMPVMDGIELMKELQKRKIPIKIVVISNHEEYGYVRQAMKLGAYDYLIKACFKASELQSVLDSLRSELLLAGVSDIPLSVERHENAKDFRRLLLDVYDARTLEKFSRLFPTEGYRLCCFTTSKQESASIDSIYHLFLRTSHEFSPVLTFRYSNCQILSVICHCQDILWIHYFVNTMVSMVESYLKVPCFVSVSREEKDYGQFKKLYEETMICNERWFYMQSPKIVYYDDMGELFFKDEKDSRIGGLFAEMKQAIEYNELDQICLTAGRIFQCLRESQDILPKIIKNDFINIVNQCTNVLRRLDFPSSDIDRLFAYTDIAEKSDLYELEQWLSAFLDKYKKMIQQASDEAVRNEAVVKSIRFLDKHYTEHVGLAEVANHANLSMNYFSALFKRVMGMGVVEYLNQKRVEAAKEHLSKSPDPRVSEVAYQVGFDSISYFCKTFKQYAGMTPAEYKRRQNNKIEQ